jgi:hypothetical protein
LSVLITRTCSQRSPEEELEVDLDAEVVAWLELADVAVAWARTMPGMSKATPATRSAVLAKKPLLISNIDKCLLAGAVPAFGDRYENGAKKVSLKKEVLKFGVLLVTDRAGHVNDGCENNCRATDYWGVET